MSEISTDRLQPHPKLDEMNPSSSFPRRTSHPRAPLHFFDEPAKSENFQGLFGVCIYGMKQDGISTKIIAIVLIGGACFLASMFVLGLVRERQGRFVSAKQEIAEKWSARQVIVGPMIISHDPVQDIDTYVLPEALRYETVLEPEVRSRGIFKSVVYAGTVKVSGEFLRDDVRGASQHGSRTATFSVAITDTGGIEEQLDLLWNGTAYAFNPSPGAAFLESSGLHADVPIDSGSQKISFSFELRLKGSEGMSIAPLGKETVITMSSLWPSPSFVGAFLPSQRELTPTGFRSEWRISSFGRSYPQTWQSGEVALQQLIVSSAGGGLAQSGGRV